MSLVAAPPRCGSVSGQCGWAWRLDGSADFHVCRIVGSPIRARWTLPSGLGFRAPGRLGRRRDRRLGNLRERAAPSPHVNCPTRVRRGNDDPRRTTWAHFLASVPPFVTGNVCIARRARHGDVGWRRATGRVDFWRACPVDHRSLHGAPGSARQSSPAARSMTCRSSRSTKLWT